MTGLLVALATIALVDSLSVVPFCIVVLIILLAGPRPVLGVAAFLAGIVVVYYPFGLLVLLGLDSVLDQLDAYLSRLWHEPNTIELAVQIGLGLVLVFFATRTSEARTGKKDPHVAPGITPGQAFGFALGFTLLGLPGALPFFAAADQMLRADLSDLGLALALAFYVAVFILPLIAIAVARWLLGRRADPALAAMQAFLERFGGPAIRIALIGLGVVLVVEGIGWLFGHPLIPV